MKIAIDASNLSRTKTGIDFMTEGIIEGLASFPEHKYLIYVTTAFRRGKNIIPVVDKYPGKFEIVRIPQSKGPASGLRWYWKATRDMRRKQVDAFISTWTFTAALMFPRTIQIVPDLSPLVFPAMYTRKHRWNFRFTLGLAMRKAWKVATISQAMADEMRSRYHREVHVFPLSLNDWALQQPSIKEVINVKGKYDLPKHYFLSISTIQPRKNYENMIKAFAKFSYTKPDFKYLIVGKKGWLFDEVFNLVRNLQLQNKVIFLDYAPDEDLPVLLDNSAGLLYASVYEGFGIPALNAAYRGVPVLLSELPVFREILTEEEAIFVNPFVVDSIAGGLEKLSEMPKAKGQKSKDLLKKYSWQSAAGELLKLID